MRIIMKIGSVNLLLKEDHIKVLMDEFEGAIKVTKGYKEKWHREAYDTDAQIEYVVVPESGIDMLEPKTEEDI
jgi:hypothetical protein